MLRTPPNAPAPSGRTLRLLRRPAPMAEGPGSLHNSLSLVSPFLQLLFQPSANPVLQHSCGTFADPGLLSNLCITITRNTHGKNQIGSLVLLAHQFFDAVQRFPVRGSFLQRLPGIGFQQIVVFHRFPVFSQFLQPQVPPNGKQPGSDTALLPEPPDA